jgi:hypothetical protein
MRCPGINLWVCSSGSAVERVMLSALMPGGRQCPYTDKTQRGHPQSRKHPTETHQLSHPQPPQTLFLSLTRFLSSCLTIQRSVFALFNVQLSVYFGWPLARRGPTRALQRWLLTLSGDEPSRPTRLCLGSVLDSPRLPVAPSLNRLPAANSRVSTKLSIHGPRSF